MNENTPLQLAIEQAKRKLRAAVRETQNSCGLPSYLIGLILDEVRSEVASIQLQEMAALYQPKPKEENS